jgi:hypothetical protein
MKKVPCYSLLDFLLPGDIENLRPYLRATFTETWAAMGDGSHDDVGDAVETIENISGVEYRCDNNCDSALSWANHGRRVEKALYVMAVDRELRVIMGPDRRVEEVVAATKAEALEGMIRKFADDMEPIGHGLLATELRSRLSALRWQA